MQPLALSNNFTKDTTTHRLGITYHPQSIYINIFDKSTKAITEGYFNQETLPQQVRQECEKLKDLFQFLSSQKSTDIVVNNTDLSFKVVRIKKERWYNLRLSLLQTPSFKPNSPEPPPTHFEETNISSAKGERQTNSEKQSLKLQNSRMKAQIKQLKKSNRLLKQTAQSKQLQLNRLKNKKQQTEGQYSSSLCLTGRFYKHQYRQLKLQVNNNCSGRPSYNLNRNSIQKASKNLVPLVFRNAIQTHDKVSISLKIERLLLNDWIVFGLLTEKLFNSQFCYCYEQSVALEGSLGVVFVEMQMLKCHGKLSPGDSLQLSIGQEEMVWSINKKPVCVHLKPQSLMKQQLYPFLLLSQEGDRVILHSDDCS